MYKRKVNFVMTIVNYVTSLRHVLKSLLARLEMPEFTKDKILITHNTSNLINVCSNSQN